MAKPKKRVSKLSYDSKKKTKSEKRRSQAAKKGWETRRKNEAAKTKKKSIKKTPVKKKTSPKKRKSTSKPLTRNQLIEENKRLTRILERERSTRDWVPLAENEDLHKDGTLAAWPSSARHKKWSERVRNDMVEARKTGEVSLADVVRYYSHMLDVPAQELYTLLMSP